MKVRDVLFEMPYLAVGTMDWGLEDPIRNRRRAGVILNTEHDAVRDGVGGKLYRRRTVGGGDFAFISDETGLIRYFMEYRGRAVPQLGNSATQVKIWSAVAVGTTGLAADIFFNTILVEYDTMISDRVQTEDGRRFWLRRMIEATSKGLIVGLLDAGDLNVYDPTTGFERWVASVDAWGRDPAHHERLFFISKRR